MSYMGSRSADAHCLSRRMTESQNPGFGHPPLQYSERHHSKPELYQKTALLLFSRTSCTEILFLTCSLNPVFIHSFFPYFFFPSIYPRDIDRIIFFFFSVTDGYYYHALFCTDEKNRLTEFIQLVLDTQLLHTIIQGPAPNDCILISKCSLYFTENETSSHRQCFLGVAYQER